MNRRLAMPGSLAAAVIAGAVLMTAIAGVRAPAAPAAQRLTTATVVRTDLATTVLTGGTLGYAAARPVINRLAGTYTSLPAAGRTIRAGRVLYRVDNEPVILLAGRIPAWRPFTPGMTGGPDVAELQANLIALGYASGLLPAPTGQFDLLTDLAVRRWQAAAGCAITGQIALGQVIFLPAAARVGAPRAAVGQPAVPGAAPYQATTARRTVIVPVSQALPPVAIGERVTIVLPSQARTPGTVTAVGPAPPGSAPAASTALTVTPSRPAATGTGTAVPVQVAVIIQSVRHVLAVPVSALLALAGGGYGMELVLRSGAHRLVAVSTGVFAGGLVQVSGADIAPGTKVVVAQ